MLHGKKKRSHLGDTLERSTGPCCAKPYGHRHPFLVLPRSLGLPLPSSKTRIPCQTHRAISPCSNATAAHSSVLFSRGHCWVRALAHPQKGAQCLGLPQCVPAALLLTGWALAARLCPELHRDLSTSQHHGCAGECRGGCTYQVSLTPPSHLEICVLWSYCSHHRICRMSPGCQALRDRLLAKLTDSIWLTFEVISTGTWSFEPPFRKNRLKSVSSVACP